MIKSRQHGWALKRNDTTALAALRRVTRAEASWAAASAWLQNLQAGKLQGET